MSGEFYALACAFLWATSSALIKSQAHKMSVISLNALRAIPAVAIYWAMVALSGKGALIGALTTRAWVLLLLSALLGLVVGDVLYFQSMKLIGLARAMPLSTIYPFFTLLLSLLFLDEGLDWTTAVGAVLIVGGAYLLAFSKNKVGRDAGQVSPRVNAAGVSLALGAALLWSASTVMLRVGLEGVDTTLANALRLSLMLLVLLPVAIRQKAFKRAGEGGIHTWGAILLAGIAGTGLGTFTFMRAIQYAGAARTSVLTAATPLFGVPLALLLGEKPSLRTLFGTVLTVAGVWLTVV
ncbi:MAG: DMT family transporter [Anaerolineae bacterium]|nr:DMT family transporter [Anaerolineae bacterium]